MLFVVIKKQLNIDSVNDLGIYGKTQSEIEQRLKKMALDIDNAIDRRMELVSFDVYGLSFDLLSSVFRPVEIICSYQNKDYSFLYKKYNKDLIKAIISHYLFDNAELNKNSGPAIISASKRECERLHLCDNEEIKSDVEYLVQWLSYICNKISDSFMS